MKKIEKRRLVLSRNTIKNLTSGQLGGVAGAQTIGSCTALVEICGSLDTQFIHGCDSGF